MSSSKYKIKVLEVRSAVEIAVQLVAAAPLYAELQQRLQARYGRGDNSPLTSLAGSCAVQHCGAWYRGKDVQRSAIGGDCRVLLLDAGKYINCRPSSLYVLYTEFVKCTSLAFFVHLLIPSLADMKDDPSIIQFIKDSVTGKDEVLMYRRGIPTVLDGLFHISQPVEMSWTMTEAEPFSPDLRKEIFISQKTGELAENLREMRRTGGVDLDDLDDTLEEELSDDMSTPVNVSVSDVSFQWRDPELPSHNKFFAK